MSNLERYDNFCDQNMLEGYHEGFFNQDLAVGMQEELTEIAGLACGPSTGATYWLAKDIVAKNSSAKVVFICADGKRPEQTDVFMPLKSSSSQKFAGMMMATSPETHKLAQASA